MAANLERRSENLAFVFQEVLTVGERLRSGRQAVSDANSFRQQIRDGLKLADNEARKRGYAAEDIQLAVFAVIAFLDESILNLRHPIFADWPRRPLQEEFFGHHVAGEVFFQNLQKILGRGDSQDLADLLEVYHLCLLLGFAGRYSMSGRGELQSMIQAMGDRIERIRQTPRELSPSWMLPQDRVQTSAADPWVRRLLFLSAGLVLLSLVLFAVYKFSLGGAVDEIEKLASLAIGVRV